MHQSVLSQSELASIATDKFIEKEYTKCGVRRELVELFNEFSNNLLIRIHNHYLGKEYLNKKEDILAYFNWCYNTTCDDYNKIGFDFSKNQKLIEWFYIHALRHIFDNKYYKYEEDKGYDIDYVNSIMTYNMKNRLIAEVLTMTDLYAIFKESL